AGRQRLVDDLGGADVGLQAHAEAMLLERLAVELAEDVLLREVLGAERDDGRRRLARRRPASTAAAGQRRSDGGHRDGTAHLGRRSRIERRDARATPARDRQREAEGAALGRRALDPYAAAVLLDDPLADGKADAGA